MEKTFKIKLPNGEIATKQCYVANQGSKYNVIPVKYLSNLKYVDDKGDVKTLVGTLTHTVFWEDIETLITGFEFRFQDLTNTKERSVVFVDVNEKETYAIGTANFVLNFLTGKKDKFAIQRKDDDFSSYMDVDVLYDDINLGPLHGVVSLLEAKKDISVASSLYEAIRDMLSRISTDVGLQCAYLVDVTCTPLDKTTTDLLIPTIERFVGLSYYETKASRDPETSKMRTIGLGEKITEESMLFFDGEKWYHYTRGAQLFSHLLQMQKHLLNIARQSQLGEIG